MRARNVLAPLNQASDDGCVQDTIPVHAATAPGRGDWDLNPSIRDDLSARSGLRPAAVLVPVIARDELSVLLTRRPDHMTSHAGQVSFPGGKIEHDDDGPVDAALRETHEEVGIGREFIEPLGLLDAYRTSTGFDITPVVALVRPGFNLDADQNEVAEVFEVPLRFLMDEQKYEQHAWDWQGKTYQFHAISYDGHYIWGATAGMLKNLLERLNK